MRKFDRRICWIEHLFTAALAFSVASFFCYPSVILQSDLHPGASKKNTLAITTRETFLPRPTTFLLGIFCTANDTNHRRLTRSTMLKSPQLPLSVQSRVCSLTNFLNGIRPENGICQIIYAFVTGVEDNSLPTEFAKFPVKLVIEEYLPSEPDVVALNIKENMNEGKTPSWFHFASTLINRGIDYVSKVDLDTLISLPQLLRFINDELPPRSASRPPRVYGGLLMDFEACGGKWWPAKCMPAQGKVYMSGQFYFASYDIVQHQSTWRLNRTFKERKHEDLNFGVRVWAYPHPVKIIALNPSYFWYHGLKNESLWVQGFHRMKNLEQWNVNETYFASGIFKPVSVIAAGLRRL